MFFISTLRSLVQKYVCTLDNLPLLIEWPFCVDTHSYFLPLIIPFMRSSVLRSYVSCSRLIPFTASPQSFSLGKWYQYSCRALICSSEKQKIYCYYCNALNCKNWGINYLDHRFVSYRCPNKSRPSATGVPKRIHL